MRALAIILTLLGGLASPLGAVAAPTLGDFLEANAWLSEAIEEGRDLPRLSKRTDEVMLRRAYDPAVFNTVDWNNLPLALDVCTAGSDGFMAYSAGNAVIRYQDEAVLATSFSLQCFARMAPAAGRFWDTLPASERTDVRRAGIRQIQKGAFQMYVGVLTWQSASAVHAANRDALLSALSDSNAGLGALMTPGYRKQVDAALDSFAKKAPEGTRSELVRLRRELAALPCIGLCAV